MRAALVVVAVAVGGGQQQELHCLLQEDGVDLAAVRTVDRGVAGRGARRAVHAAAPPGARGIHRHGCWQRGRGQGEAVL